MWSIPGLNTRETALAFWLLIGLIWALLNRSIRVAMWNVILTLSGSKLRTLFASALLYAGVAILVLWRIGFWDPRLLKSSILWFFGVGGAASILTIDESQYTSFRKVAFAAFAVSALVEFFVNLYTFPLIVELFLIPLLFLIVTLQAVSAALPEFRGPRHDATKGLLSGLLSALGLAIIAYSIFETARHWQDVFSTKGLEDFLLPVILTMWFLPYVYAVRLYATFEMIFLRARLAAADDAQLLRYYRKNIIRACGLNLWRAQRFSAEFSGRLWGVTNIGDAAILFQEFRETKGASRR